MRIAIGFKIIQGPWGGGNQFAQNLQSYLSNRGWHVTNDLGDPDLDAILLTEPRKNLASSSFNHLEVAHYVKSHPSTIVVHRINECDERKNTKGVNAFLMQANGIADHTVFISNWLKGLFQRYKHFTPSNSSVILNGADEAIFNDKNYIRWDKRKPLKLVTHHWSGNWMKGFDVYTSLDSLIGSETFTHPIAFTYIGNIPENVRFTDTTVVRPKSGRELARELATNHVYLTGSLNEPAGMHHIEGCLCGLPPLYRKSGGVPEHCEAYGVGFNDPSDFEDALHLMIDNYDHYAERIKQYPFTASVMCKKYESTFEQLVEKNTRSRDLKARAQKAASFLRGQRFHNLRRLLRASLGKSSSNRS